MKDLYPIYFKTNLKLPLQKLLRCRLDISNVHMTFDMLCLIGYFALQMITDNEKFLFFNFNNSFLKLGAAFTSLIVILNNCII